MKEVVCLDKDTYGASESEPEQRWVLLGASREHREQNQKMHELRSMHSSNSSHSYGHSVRPIVVEHLSVICQGQNSSHM